MKILGNKIFDSSPKIFGFAYAQSKENKKKNRKSTKGTQGFNLGKKKSKLSHACVPLTSFAHAQHELKNLCTLAMFCSRLLNFRIILLKVFFLHAEYAITIFWCMLGVCYKIFLAC